MYSNTVYVFIQCELWSYAHALNIVIRTKMQASLDSKARIRLTSEVALWELGAETLSRGPHPSENSEDVSGEGGKFQQGKWEI
jgi:hypothetical protein